MTPDGMEKAQHIAGRALLRVQISLQNRIDNKSQVKIVGGGKYFPLSRTTCI